MNKWGQISALCLNRPLVLYIVWVSSKGSGETAQIPSAFAVKYPFLMDWLKLRNRLALAVNCWVIIHCLEVSCKGDQITSWSMSDLSAYNWPTVNYYSTIHALELIYFDSNTQETMKKQLYPSNTSNFPPLHWRNSAKSLTVMHAFTYISYVYYMQKRCYTVYRQGDMVDGKVDVIKWCQIAPHISAQWVFAD